jgi:hypothetical protein
VSGGCCNGWSGPIRSVRSRHAVQVDIEWCPLVAVTAGSEGTPVSGVPHVGDRPSPAGNSRGRRGHPEERERTATSPSAAL